MTCYKCNGTGLWGGVDNDLYDCDECQKYEKPQTIYTLPDSNHTGTYCGIDDGGTKYIRADALIEMLERMMVSDTTARTINAYQTARIINNFIDAAIEKIKEMR